MTMTNRGWWVVAAAVLVLVGGLVARFAMRDESTAQPTTTAPAPAAIHRAPGVVGTSAAKTKGELAHSDVGTLRLEGQVIDEQLQPIGGAQVTLLLEQPRKATTEEDGSFAFDHLAPGPYRLIAHKDAQASAIARARVSATSEPVTLRVRPGATVAVRVVAADGGAPIAGATVADRARAIITGADGIAALGGMAEYGTVDITAPGYAPQSFMINKPEEPGGTIERTVALARGVVLSGTVVGPDGAPITDATVHVEGAASEWSGSAKTDAKGAWSFPVLAADKYAVTASSESYTAAAPLVVAIDGKTPRTGVVVRVEVGAQLVGTVVDPAGRPVAGASVRLANEDGTSYDAVTEANGTFALLGVSTGAFWVSATTAAQSTSRVEVTLVRDQRIEVHLVLADSSLAGIVVDTKGEPIAEAVVSARPRLLMVGRIPAERTDARGAFDFGGLPGGEYQLVVSRPEQNDARRLEGTKVTVPDRTVKLVVPDVSSITGRVLLDGKPLPYYGLIVTDHPEFSWQDSPVAVRSAEGRFTHKGVAPGSWGVVIGAPGVARKVIENVVVTEGKVTAMGDITLDRGQQLRGRVTTANGAAVPGATVSLSEGIAFLAETPLKLSMQGSMSTITDATGAYQLAGIVREEHNEIVATHPTLGSSGTRKLSPKVSTLDLVIAPVGGIDGTIVGAAERVHIVNAVLLTGEKQRFSAQVDATGTFRLDNLEPGNYSLDIFAGPGKAAPPGIRVAVVANERTAATLTVPSSAVTLAVHYGAACRMVLVHPSEEGTHDMIASAMCDDKGNAVIEGVSPGEYRVCAIGGGCAKVTVTPTPARQTLEIPAAK